MWNLTTEEGFSRLTKMVALLTQFPIRCTCRICFTVCSCSVTGVCGPDTHLFTGLSYSSVCPRCSDFASTIGCPVCVRDGCQADFGDRLWVKPGTLAVVIEPPKFNKFTRQLDAAYPTCLGYHYRRGEGDADQVSVELCRGNIVDKINYVLAHSACRYEPDIGERDEELENWRDMLADLRPGELPPY